MLHRSFNETENMCSLEKYISDRSYMIGYQPTVTDAKIFVLVNNNSNVVKEVTGGDNEASHKPFRVTYYLLLLLLSKIRVKEIRAIVWEGRLCSRFNSYQQYSNMGFINKLSISSTIFRSP